MLYLFNSGARPEYVRNVLNTLHLPNGAINTYQYESMPYDYVDSSVFSVSEGERVVISFIDRDDVEPQRNKYIPLRFGVLKKCEKNQGKLYIYVELKNFVSTESNFDSELKSSFQEKLFYKENGTEHGFLAFAGKEVVSAQNDGDAQKWIDTVKRVMDCSKLKNSNCVYTHLTIRDKKGKAISPVSKEKDWEYNLKSNRAYKVNIDYYIPFAEETSDADIIYCEFINGGNKHIKQFKNSWGVQNGRCECDFFELNEKETLAINYLLSYTDTSKKIIYSDKSACVTVLKSCWLLKFFPFALFGFSAFISTLIASMNDYVIEVQKNSDFLWNLVKWIFELDAVSLLMLSGACAVGQALSLLWIKKLLSKGK